MYTVHVCAPIVNLQLYPLSVHVAPVERDVAPPPVLIVNVDPCILRSVVQPIGVDPAPLAEFVPDVMVRFAAKLSDAFNVPHPAAVYPLTVALAALMVTFTGTFRFDVMSKFPAE